MFKEREKISPIAYLERHPGITNLIIFLLFVVYASVANWSILIGENLMKWDIWQAEYPQQVLISDAIAGGTFPLWNPLMRYGTPLYATVGTPIWYPFTLLLDLIGYEPNTVAVSYVMHIALGGFGMFLLAKQELHSKKRGFASVITASLIAGILYCSSGTYLSNAQHIMIIISVAWVPYVFYFVRLYIAKEQLVYGMSAGVCAGLILTGGYPEAFYNLFIFLAFYMLFFTCEKDKKILENFVHFCMRFFLVCCFTVLYSAILLLPFLMNKGLITRGNGLGQVVNSYPMGVVLSMLIPNMNEFFSDMECSMMNYYMGLLPIALLPLIIKIKGRNKTLYAGLSGMAFLLCCGNYGFLHPLFYRFLPMYADFRFPTLNRCFLALFVLLLLAAAICEIVDTQLSYDCVRFIKIVFFPVLISGIVLVVVGGLLSDGAALDATKCKRLSHSCLIASGLLGAYVLVFMKYKEIKRSIFSAILTAAVVLEALTFFYEATPNTIAAYGPTAYAYDYNVKQAIDSEFQANADRNRSVDFSNSIRTTSALNSQSIVHGKTFDEDGYVSFLLKRTSEFKETYVRSIMEQNPEVYFTNNVVTESDIPYDQWVRSCDVSPEQIYAEAGLQERDDVTVRFEPEAIDNREINYSITGDGILIEGPIGASSNQTGRVRLFLDGETADRATLNLTFVNDAGVETQYSGDFRILRKNGECYADVYFPDVNQIYQTLTVAAPDVKMMSAALVTVERMKSDGVTKVKKFGFNDIEMEVDAPSEGYVTILQAKHHGWKAYLDGEEADVSLVNGTFMGVHVDEGVHTIELKFRPTEFFIGALLSGMYCVAFAVVLIGSLRNKKLYRVKRNQ